MDKESAGLTGPASFPKTHPQQQSNAAPERGRALATSTACRSSRRSPAYPFGKRRGRDLTVMGGKAEPAATLQGTTERRPTPAAAPPWGQFGHVTSFLSGKLKPRCTTI